MFLSKKEIKISEEYLNHGYVIQNVNDIKSLDWIRNHFCKIIYTTVPKLKKNVQNPVHLIPEVADSGWVRGGIPSRLLIQDSDYLQQCGYPLPGKSLIQ